MHWQLGMMDRDQAARPDSIACDRPPTIGVVADPAEHPAIREFFELFKTPWEFYRSDRSYEVVVCAGDGEFVEGAARLVLIYAGRKLALDSDIPAEAGSPQPNGRMLAFGEARVPIYGDSVTFDAEGFLKDPGSLRACGYCAKSGAAVTVARIGYDLFREVKILLTTGQPACNAYIPTLDIHISLLRGLILECGVTLVEMPPVPEGYRFIACLTHDVDHPSIRRHWFDHTMLGFLYRAVIRSAFRAAAGLISLNQLLTNWAAALKLPFVYMGLAEDFWEGFDRYPGLEGPKSTFFVIPFEDDPGRSENGPAPGERAARYGAAHIARQIHALQSQGCEIGLHGIDAWRESSKGRKELEEIRRVAGKTDIGVRMHWLYFGPQSPAALEDAGADYDSTVGYNDAIGFRAGTMQVYKPFGATRLMELPLHIMDTALFYPNRMDLSPKEAKRRVDAIIDSAVRYGGCVTINWHDRSIAPERLWGDFYVELVEDLKKRGAWFATAAETVAWFRERRASGFGHPVSAPARGESAARELPGIVQRVHAGAVTASAETADLAAERVSR